MGSNDGIVGINVVISILLFALYNGTQIIDNGSSSMSKFRHLITLASLTCLSQACMAQGYYKCGNEGGMVIVQDHPCGSPNPGFQPAQGRIKSHSEIQLEGMIKEALNAGDLERAQRLAINDEQRALINKHKAQIEAAKPKQTVCSTSGYMSPYGYYNGSTRCRER